jgi:hypothetical protein
MGPGWNLVTYGGPGGSTSQALVQLGTKYIAVYYWDGTRWWRYFPPHVAPSYLSNLTSLSPGQPVWILATASIP